MGTGSSKPPRNVQPAAPVPVTLNVYDLGTSSAVRALNRVLRDLGSGAFHVGVEVGNHEWSYGHCGIFSSPPRSCMGHSFSEAVPMGMTDISEREVFKLVRLLEKDWPGSKYDIIHHNCCQFSNHLCVKLGVGPIPAWVMRLASAGSSMTNCGTALGLGPCCCVQTTGNRVEPAENSLAFEPSFPVCCGHRGMGDEHNADEAEGWVSMPANTPPRKANGRPRHEFTGLPESYALPPDCLEDGAWKEFRTHDGIDHAPWRSLLGTNTCNRERQRMRC